MHIKGKYTDAKIFIENINYQENYAAINQVKSLCDLKILENSKIRIMPDMCPAIGTTIGSTFTYSDKIIPSLVSGDIGCGITFVKLKEKRIELEKIDKIIKEQLIERKKIDNIVSKYENRLRLENLKCKKYVDIDRCYSKLGELGGGNHFCSIGEDSKGFLYITIHSGSRLLGQQIYDYYISEEYKQINDKSYNRLYTYLEGPLMNDYLHDQQIAVEFASLNRQTIIDIICKFSKLTQIETIESVHNYVDTKNKIIRKGAISALKNEQVIIPISASRKYGGILLGVGKGNEDWNYSAPHGAGRICSRGESKNLFSFNQYKKEMEGVHSMSIKKETINESPMVYKERNFIINNIKDSVEIENIILPIYDFKNSEK